MSCLYDVSYFLASYGLAWSIVYAKPLRPINQYLTNIHFTLAELLACIVCTGFWCGFLLAFVFFPENSFLFNICVAFSNVTFTWILANILKD